MSLPQPHPPISAIYTWGQRRGVRRIFTTIAAATILFTINVASAQSTNCPFAVAGGANSAANATRDGLLMLRYARGLRDDALVAGTGAVAATVQGNIVANTKRLDLNGNGLFDADDAAVAARLLLSFSSGSWLTPASGGAGKFASRSNAATLKAYVDSGCTVPTLGASSLDAARFLTQATFGASAPEIVAFNTLAGSTHTAKVQTWLTQQFNTPRANTHFSEMQRRQAVADARNPPGGFYADAIRESFWQQAVLRNDQLRQRLAFALSQILVVSSNGASNNPYELAAYLDLLNDGAFGNFRDLLYNVSRSVAMGQYLDHLRNDGNSTTPNENFARELLQLFSVGLVELNNDGSNKVGNPATYTEDMVKGFARVFTGFAVTDPYTAADGLDIYGGEHPNWYFSPDDGDRLPNAVNSTTRSRNAWRVPMKPFVGRHSTAAKPLLKYNYANPVAACSAAVAFANNGAATLPALVRTPPPGTYDNNGTTEQDALNTLDAAINNIFCHPNVGPFISKGLIRFFVTSTPTPAYVGRVAAAFNNTAGVRGDMKAVITAILTDPEAINPSSLAATDRTKFGKLKEPILRLSAILRAFNARSSSNQYGFGYTGSLEYGINQGPLQSPSVFNFFHPEFAPPGPVSLANALGPEFEITTTTSIAATANFFGGLVSNSDYASDDLFGQSGLAANGDCDPGASPPLRTDCIYSNYSDLYTLSDNMGTLFDYLSIVLMQGTLDPASKTDYVNTINTLFPYLAAPAGTEIYQINEFHYRRRDRVKAALWLAVHTPEFQIQQ
jgi:endo-chitodextinase